MRYTPSFHSSSRCWHPDVHVLARSVIARDLGSSPCRSLEEPLGEPLTPGTSLAAAHCAPGARGRGSRALLGPVSVAGSEHLVGLMVSED